MALSQTSYKIKLNTITHENGNRLFPTCDIDGGVFKEFCKPWEEVLIVKIPGLSIGLLKMKDKLQNFWKPSSGIEI